MLNCVFGIVVCEDFPSLDKNEPRFLMVPRADQKLGFPGGRVDDEDGELSLDTLRKAVKREMFEELAVKDIDDSNLELFTTHRTDTQCIHTFLCKVDEETFKNIMIESVNAHDMLYEIYPPIAIPYSLLETIDKVFPYMGFAGSCKEELNELITHYQSCEKLNCF